MAEARTGRRKAGARAAEALAPPAATEGSEVAWSPRSGVFVGLCSVVMAVPLAVLGAAAGPYDDAKGWALPILVALTALAWLARPPASSSREIPGDDRPSRVVRGAVLALVGWSVITTAASIAPGQSLLGSFGRGLGLLTVGSAMLLFVLVHSACRTAGAIRALVDAALLGSAPVCLLALGQSIGWDPLPASWDPAVATLRVRSTLGQHIFLGSYLALLVPLAAARLDRAVRERRAKAPGPARPRARLRALAAGAVWIGGVLALVGLAASWPPAWWALVPWGVAGALAWALVAEPERDGARGPLPVALLGTVLAAQVLVVILSAARGPLLGLLFGFSVVGLALLARRRAWKPLGLAVATVGALLAALLLLNVARSWLGPLAEVGVLARLGELTDVRRGTPVWFRIEVWRGILSGWDRQLRGEQIIPGTGPWARSLLGYGLDTQIFTLDQLSLPAIGVFETEGSGWRGQYLVDRAHSALLDQLVTGGMVGAGLWVVAIGSVLTVGIMRVRGASPGEETSMRLGCLGAVLVHLAEGQVGIVTATPLVLFWAAAAVLTSTPPWTITAPPARARGRWWIVAAVAGALVAALVAWATTRWLVASTAYADGVRRHIAGQPGEALAHFRRSRDLMPWLPLPAEALASSALRLAGSEPDPARRLDLLREGEAALAEARRHALPGAASWALAAQIALSEAREGDRSKLGPSLDAFETACRLRPRDASLRAQWALAWLESGDAFRARQAATHALGLPGGRGEWLAWAVLAQSSRDLGALAEARRAAERARRVAPPGARRLLEGLP